MRYRTWSYRFADEILNSKYSVKKELEDIIRSTNLPASQMTRKALNHEFAKKFAAKGWQGQPELKKGEIESRMDFLKERVGIEVAFTHPSFLGIDLLKFQTASYANLD